MRISRLTGGSAVLVIVLAGTADDGSVVMPDALGWPGTGGGESSAPAVDEFYTWNTSEWLASKHSLGRGWLDPGNVSHADGVLDITVADGGGEIQSASRVQYRSIEARIRTPNAPGSLSAFFLYEFVQRWNDEIDIEILNDILLGLLPQHCTGQASFEGRSGSFPSARKRTGKVSYSLPR